MLGFGRSLCNKENDETGRYKRHGDDDKDGDYKICALTPVREVKERYLLVFMTRVTSSTKLLFRYLLKTKQLNDNEINDGEF